ncbi:MAG: hypothetical protein M1829_002225 [Trizodia sp. TS-e1964]|nr:MAG: hypothetical protein M1829_002225 [Trizodia sp. TS-e1964]
MATSTKRKSRSGKESNRPLKVQKKTPNKIPANLSKDAKIEIESPPASVVKTEMESKVPEKQPNIRPGNLAAALKIEMESRLVRAHALTSPRRMFELEADVQAAKIACDWKRWTAHHGLHNKAFDIWGLANCIVQDRWKVEKIWEGRWSNEDCKKLDNSWNINEFMLPYSKRSSGGSLPSTDSWSYELKSSPGPEDLASRPINRFKYASAKLVEALKKKAFAEGKTSTAAELASRADNLVKHTWLHHGIWNFNWAEKPGNKWQHELPFSEYIPDKRTSAERAESVALYEEAMELLKTDTDLTALFETVDKKRFLQPPGSPKVVVTKRKVIIPKRENPDPSSRRSKRIADKAENAWERQMLMAIY